jgi:hypothetical protein
VVLAACLTGCGGGDDSGSGGERNTPQSTAPGPTTESAGTHPDAGAAETTPASEGARALIEATVRRYVASINAADGAALCGLFAPAGLAEVELPVRRPSCAASLSSSIGHPGPAGSPRWLRTRLVDADSVVRIEGALGRLTGTVVHRFAGSREPSIEDDVIYLRRVSGRWRIAKPSSTFYRAIGVRDVPIEALRPP